ncbi:GNAT family N-acetyltransferase [Pseudalkalibacillus sp. Hm43]|uniref:GNAT family N-acetyltransferase n=1 Tax=Pseudalkalibacillus sp. Hm43 TaxID=3450742 RepID=UPI003F43018D
MKGNFPSLETERLKLREVTNGDANDLYLYLSDPEVMKHMGLQPYESAESVQDEIDWYASIYGKGTGIRWGITIKGDDRVIGSCGFLNYQSKHHRAEVGFELHKAQWGKGIAAEALQAVLKYGFEQFELERIEALIEPANTPSQRLVENQGFLREGLLRHYEYTCGKFDDLYMYSILRSDFE